MEEEKITKEIVEKFMSIHGEARGVTIKVDWEFILKKEGKEALEKLENRMAELGYPLKFEEIETMGFYPIGLDALSMAVISEIFNYDEQKFFEVGSTAPKFSIFLKVFLKYFISPEQAIQEASKMWRQHYSVGDLIVTEFNEEKGYTVLRLENFKHSKIHCYNLLGYFSKILEMIINTKVFTEERKCVFSGDSYHEYFLRWK